MAIQERPRQPKKPLVLSNNLLFIIIGVLAVLLVVLIVLSVNIGNTPPADTRPSSEPTTTPTTAPTTAPTAAPTTAPTAPTLPVTPSGGNYVNVGSGYIVEVIRTNVETFDGDTNDDYSHPTNNYLPEGTVDYCAREPVYGGKTAYVLMRSGHRTYIKKKIYPPVEYVPEVKQYEGTLPDHNDLSVVSLQMQGNHTILTLDTLWKAPFYFELAPQRYRYPNGKGDRDYAVTSVTATYIDITFCYATSFSGQVQIPAGHPLFKSAEVIQNESDCTLRLHLRKAGGFYGWHAYYNDQDQLCFQFLNPAKATAAQNKYGVNLTGVRIMLDVGHGGMDGGAVGKDAAGIEWEEADLNLSLALALKAELESAGATVIMNRTGDTKIDINARLDDLVDTAPDICVAIHQNSYTNANVSGFDAMYYTPFSQPLAEKIYSYTTQSGVYQETNRKWSVVYFMMRQSVCPVVLTENGYVSNLEDLAGMVNPEVVQAKAEAIAHGIADYFLTINK